MPRLSNTEYTLPVVTPLATMANWAMGKSCSFFPDPASSAGCQRPASSRYSTRDLTCRSRRR
ncbi:hypothetical protein AB0F91_38905 [Amycolatopsis sp. NPDC023774]|uniref:hypothetical protein n=1 Tax=Amycolatopsis sp. NPDC023774 TaxID=3155015 RepID=UPI0033D23CEA